MIPMQVGAHDVVDVFRPDPDAGEIGEIGSAQFGEIAAALGAPCRCRGRNRSGWCALPVLTMKV